MSLGFKYFVTPIVLLFFLTSCTNPTTPLPILVPTSTNEPTNIPFVESASTPLPTNTPEAKTVVFDESTSPDGTWTGIVTVTTQGENKDLLFRVFDNSKNKEWIVEQIDIDEIETPPPGGFFYPYIFKWSQDNNHLYFSHLSTGGDGCFGYFRPGGSDLKRFDLSTGDIIAIRNDWAT